MGLPSRWLVDQIIQNRWERVFPLGTFTINVTGSLLLGFATQGTASCELMSLAGTGFCGGFTTWSTFGSETIRLDEDEAHLQAALNTSLSLAIGLLASAAGWWLTTR